ncbi:hypothetical protein TeGR_g9823 [Tetraparma gracilis]|uniref:Uncharacterized protein n=1 Tax=Tetraparma gracilis TaxID=2962635 RepID=A0ABQ6N117_9STRA|nr:hypothetical protein TeGR_g9823 [Tetraparma gracilis]
MSKSSKALTAVGLLAATSLAFAFPLIATKHNQELQKRGQGLATDSDKALPVNANSRGVFINSGSKDVGRDPLWDSQLNRRVDPRRKP